MFSTHTAKLIALKDAKRTLRTPGIYLAYMFACGVIALYAWFFSSLQASSGVGVSAAFPASSLLTAVGIYALYMAVSSVSAVARERQDKTLEVLFYGPVNESSFIAGKYAGRMIPYLILAVATLIYITLISLALNSGAGADMITLSIFSLLLISCVVSLGIMLSTITGSVTGAIFILIAFMLGLFVLKVLGFILSMLPAFNPMLTLAKDIVATLLNITQYISPVEYLGIGLDAAGSNDPWKYLLAFLYPAVYTCVMLLLSAVILKKKGVRR
jgi:ABC-type transport system involved in multi-copper enzyme maturation permease subunit